MRGRMTCAFTREIFPFSCESECFRERGEGMLALGVCVCGGGGGLRVYA